MVLNVTILFVVTLVIANAMHSVFVIEGLYAPLYSTKWDT